MEKTLSRNGLEYAITELMITSKLWNPEDRHLYERSISQYNRKDIKNLFSQYGFAAIYFDISQATELRLPEVAIVYIEENEDGQWYLWRANQFWNGRLRHHFTQEVEIPGYFAIEAIKKKERKPQIHRPGKIEIATPNVRKKKKIGHNSRDTGNGFVFLNRQNL
ncbi:MAG: hypothetical protein ACOC1P_05760 [Minisyncoccales bacterium]